MLKSKYFTLVTLEKLTSTNLESLDIFFQGNLHLQCPVNYQDLKSSLNSYRKQPANNLTWIHLFPSLYSISGSLKFPHSGLVPGQLEFSIQDHFFGNLRYLFGSSYREKRKCISLSYGKENWGRIIRNCKVYGPGSQGWKRKVWNPSAINSS